MIEEKFNISQRTYLSFKESLEILAKKDSDEYINKLIEIANDKFILLLEGKTIKDNINIK